MSVKAKSVGGKLTIQRRNNEILVIFSPGRGMSLAEFQSQIRKLKRTNSQIEASIEREEIDATLVSPLGVFSGRSRIVQGLAALQYFAMPGK